jgi:uncharacterized RDD family membrane protein YckC
MGRPYGAGMGGDFWDGSRWTTLPEQFRAPESPAPVRFAYAGFWIRVVANVIDTIVLIVPVGLLTLVGGRSPGADLSGAPTTADVLVALARLLAALLTGAYFVFCWSRGRTVGMRVLGLSVVHAETGSRIGVGRAIVRYVGYLVGAFLCYLGWLWVAFDEYNQGWHDKLANTVVVYDS